MAKNFFDWNLEGWMCDFWHICDSAAFPDQCKSYHGGQICVVVFMEVKKKDTFKAEYSKNLYTCFRVFNCCFRCPVTGLYITTPFKLQDVSSISHNHFPSIKSLQDTLKIPTHAFSCLLHSVLHTFPERYTETAQTDASGWTCFCSVNENTMSVIFSLRHRIRRRGLLFQHVTHIPMKSLCVAIDTKWINFKNVTLK